MSPNHKTPRSLCPINLGLEVFGDKWTLIVIRDLLFFGKRHFKELMQAEEGIASNILTERIRRLETEGIISREKDPRSGRRMIYRLTDKGLALAPILLEIARWSHRHGGSVLSDSFIDRVENDRDALLDEVLEAARAGATVLSDPA